MSEPKELTEAEKDAARLDWLEKNGCAVRMREHAHRNVVAWYDRPIREAIDYMMAKDETK